jgi:histidyl-tRNA synthetase
MEIKLESTTKGTRILFGEDATKKRDMIAKMAEICRNAGFEEIMFPILQARSTFAGKVGQENSKMMYDLTDAGGRELCLAPEYTAIVMQLAQGPFKFTKNVKMFYSVECFRGEKPQAGRLRQFTQFGVEIINPSEDMSTYLQELAMSLVGSTVKPDTTLTLDSEATRGLDYYTGGKGFEIKCDSLGAQKQIVGGGSYPGGIGFAIGIDRLMLVE